MEFTWVHVAVAVALLVIAIGVMTVVFGRRQERLAVLLKHSTPYTMNTNFVGENKTIYNMPEGAAMTTAEWNRLPKPPPPTDIYYPVF